MGRSKPVSILRFALQILQVGFSITVIVLIFWKLFNVDIEGFNLDTNCLLDGSGRSDAISGTKFCIFTVGAAFASLLVASILGCLGTCAKCFGLKACAVPDVISLIGNIALGIWWTAIFILVLQRGRAANNLGWPERAARDWVIAASFGATFAFFADAVIAVCTLVL